MYLPAQFAEPRIESLHRFMGEHGFATLVTLGADGLDANHLPFECDPEPAPYGTLRAHVARGNPLWHDLAAGVDALVIFQGPQAYISPDWYATKPKDGRVVPTWNYMVVHAYGPLRVVEDRQALRGLLQRLTDRHEAGRARPWKLEDAPADYIDKLLGAIVLIEIPVTRLIGKWKLSQNQPAENRESVVRGLRELGTETAQAMAEAIAGVAAK